MRRRKRNCKVYNCKGATRCKRFGVPDHTYTCGLSIKCSEWYDKNTKAERILQIPLLAFEVVANRYSTLLTTFIYILKTIAKFLLEMVSRIVVMRFYFMFGAL